jgi:hypothetical protein
LRLLAYFQCRTCEDYAIEDPKKLPLFHPAVTAFYEDHGISTRVHTEDTGSARHIFDLMTDHGEELVSEDPLRVAVTAAVDGDDVRVTIDETASIVDVSR